MQHQGIGEPVVLVRINNDAHAIIAAHYGLRLTREIGFSPVDQAAVSTATLEVARNIFKYAGYGEITLNIVYNGCIPGVEVIACDNGPGIVDVQLAMRDGYSTGNSLGLGLPGAKRLMHSFTIDSSPGQGTVIVLRKWKTP